MTDANSRDRHIQAVAPWNMMPIHAGTFRMGSDSHYPKGALAHRVAVDGFWIDRRPVTNPSSAPTCGPPAI